MAAPTIKFSIDYPPPPDKSNAIGVPGPVVHLDPMGTFTARGSNDGELRRVYAAVIPGQQTPPPHPWDSSVPAYAEGGVDPSPGFWSVPNVPGARGNCLLDTFVVWYFIEDVAPDLDHRFFKGDSSGSGSGCPETGILSLGFGGKDADLAKGKGLPGKGPAPEKGPALDKGPLPSKGDAAARVYSLTICVDSLKLDALGGDYLTAGLLSSGRMYLTFDPQQSGAKAFVWTGQNLADADSYWRLTASLSGAGSATIELIRAGGKTVAQPLVWTSRNWQFLRPSRFQANGRAPGALPQPTLRIEPA